MSPSYPDVGARSAVCGGFCRYCHTVLLAYESDRDSVFEQQTLRIMQIASVMVIL
jgi:hypothetical protein